MIGLGTLAKVAKGSMGLEELEELLSSLGLAVRVTTVDGSPLESFETLAQLAQIPGAKLMQLEGASKSGERIGALFVMLPRPVPQKALDN